MYDRKKNIEDEFKFLATALKNSHCKITKIEIRGNIEITAEQRTLLINAIGNYKTLRHIEICDKDQGIREWIDMVTTHPSISQIRIGTLHSNLVNLGRCFLQDLHLTDLELDLRDMNLYDSHNDNYEQIAPLRMNINPTLTQLSFHGSFDETTHLLKALEGNTTVKTLLLPEIGTEELVELSKLLRKNSSISELNLKIRIELGDESIYVESFTQAAKKNVTIESMNVIYEYPPEWNNQYLDRENVMESHFPESLANKMICGFIVNSKSLKKFTIDHKVYNCIDIADSIAMAKALVQNTSLDYFGMLYSDNIRYDLERMQVESSIKEALERNKNLTVNIDAGNCYFVGWSMVQDEQYKMWEPTASPKMLASVILQYPEGLNVWLEISQLRAQKVYIQEEMEKIFPQSSCFVDAFIFADDLKHAKNVDDRFSLYKSFVDKLPSTTAKYFINLEQELIEMIPEQVSIMRISPSQLDLVSLFKDADKAAPSKEKFFEYANSIMSIIYMIDMERTELIKDIKEIMTNIVLEDIPAQKSFQFYRQYNLFASIVNLLLPEDMQHHLIMPRWDDETRMRWSWDKSKQHNTYIELSAEELAQIVFEKLEHKERIKSSVEFSGALAVVIEETGFKHAADIATFMNMRMSSIESDSLEIDDILGNSGFDGIYDMLLG
jgi:NTP pyrophosphatase (non-canonical NTP hydrolase)